MDAIALRLANEHGDRLALVGRGGQEPHSTRTDMLVHPLGIAGAMG